MHELCYTESKIRDHGCLNEKSEGNNFWICYLTNIANVKSLKEVRKCEEKSSAFERAKC